MTQIKLRRKRLPFTVRVGKNRLSGKNTSSRIIGARATRRG